MQFGRWRKVHLTVVLLLYVLVDIFSFCTKTFHDFQDVRHGVLVSIILRALAVSVRFTVTIYFKHVEFPIVFHWMCFVSAYAVSGV